MKSFSFVITVAFSILLGKANAQGPPTQWKFHFAFEDATGARDTIWLGLDESATFGVDEELGEAPIVLDSAAFNVWIYIFGQGMVPFKTWARPMAGSPSLTIYGMNAVLPVTLSWDTTLFNSPVLQSSVAGPVCNPILGNEWFFFNSNAGWLHHAFSMLFDTEVVLPEFSWGSQNHFPIGVALDRAHDCILTSTENASLSHSLKIYPNPCVDELLLSTDAGIVGIEVYDLQGKRVLQESKATLRGANDEIRIDVRTFPPGMYLLQATGTDGRVGMKKFVVQSSNR